jgi:hypothetical protein
VSLLLAVTLKVLSRERLFEFYFVLKINDRYFVNTTKYEVVMRRVFLEERTGFSVI